jgi:hypothetical protein
MSDEVRRILWALIKPALIAMIVAFLTALGVSVEVASLDRQRMEQTLGIAGVTHFSSVYSSDDVQAADDVIVGDDLTVGDAVAISGNLSDSSGSVRINDNALITGTLGVSSRLTLGTWGTFSAASTFTALDGLPITATGSYQPLTAAGAVTPTIETTGMTAGSVLWLVNTAAQDILIQDTGNQVLAGDATLNQYDSLLLLFDGTRWIELSRSNN